MTVTIKLDKDNYDAGQTMTLTLTEDYGDKRSITIDDSAGHAWSKTSGTDQGQGAKWTTKAKAVTGQQTIQATLTQTPDGGTQASNQVSYTVGTQTGGGGGGGGTGGLTTLGMSSPKDQWDERLREVGPEGITARRIFAKLNSDASDQMDLVEDALDAGLLPVYSFKTPNASDAANGGVDGWVTKLIDRLSAYGARVTVTPHHEPHGDMDPSVFVRMNERYLPMFDDAEEQVEFGPFLNGWLLDNKVAEFKSYTSPKLLQGWRWLGIDTYEEGDMATQPGKILPGERIPKLVKFANDNGIGGKTLRIGEYNGYSGNSIRLCGEACLDEPTVDLFMMWNSTEGKGYVLEGERLEAFKETKNDPRVAR